MNRKDLEVTFYNAFLNMDYFKATKTLGQMEANGFTNGKYRYFEMLVLYEQKEYNKIRTNLQNQKLTWQEKEIYLASLVELKQFDELEKSLYQSPQISQYCFMYICYMLSKQGFTLTRTYNAIVENDTYFQDLYKWSICFDLAEVYDINKEKIMMINAGWDDEHIQTLQTAQKAILNNIRIKDPYLEDIISCVENNDNISPEKILWFPVFYLGDKTQSLVKPFKCLRDIVNYLNLLSQVNDSCLDMEIVPYTTEITAAVKENNKAVIEVLSKIYLKTHYQNIHEINDEGTPFVAVYKSIIKRHSPDFISFIETHEIDAEIKTMLTPKGLIAYKAAVWQYDSVMSSSYGTLDAGMLCLSYMRILELEMNERIVKPLSKHEAYFKELCKTERESELLRCQNNGLKQEKINKSMKEFDNAWNCIKNLHKGIELGPLFFLLLKFREGENKYPNIVIPMLKIIQNEILTDTGIEYLKNGTIADWINNEIRESYRNPPAHTRYVGIQKALECRDYVLDKLRLLSGIIK